MPKDELIPGVPMLSPVEAYYADETRETKVRSEQRSFEELHLMLRFLVRAQLAKLQPMVDQRMLSSILMAHEPDDRSIWMHTEEGERRRQLTMLNLGQLKAMAMLAMQMMPLETDDYRMWSDRQAAEENERWQAHADRVKCDVLDAVLDVLARLPPAQIFRDILIAMKNAPYAQKVPTDGH